ncbi:patatin-like phospholipase family protein [Methyloceanibacter superfactus]|uniref:patatin-like phospholipase family protein n=1 Tax=Methyloceanibacter superfactus TaxID=1774969 RepID=UPI000849D66D|nr:patatin-like phospholipase family protein [Methyloceanibacter superfactus]
MTTAKRLSPLDAVNEIRNDNNGQVVVVLQGGGALGAYQGGVYEALHEAGIEPDWLVGTSIGAINASIIAGNEPEQRLPRLREFWHRVEAADYWGAFPAWGGAADALSSWMTMTAGISGFFEPHTRAFLGAHTPLGADNAGYYSTAPLRKTLEDLVDFNLLNRGDVRLTVGAAHVRTSVMHYFDSRDMPLTVSHVMASGALPPAFPAVRIDGELYWDGGILSNTPAERIFEDNPRRNGLIFAVHLWNPTGPEPSTIWDTLHRHKDIQYSSRIANHIVRQREAHRLRHVITELLKYVPDDAQLDPKVRELAGYACRTRMHVVRLLAPRLDNESHIKDIDFSPAGIRARWQAGYADTCRALEAQAWLGEFDALEGVILHEPAPGAEPATAFEPGQAPETMGHDGPGHGAPGQDGRKLAAE